MTEAYTFFNWTIRADMVAALERYTNTGHGLGDFLYGVVSNDLMKACSHADDGNKANIPAYAGYLFNVMPSAAHGSPAKVKRWSELGGLEGLNELHQLREKGDSVTYEEGQRLDYLESIYNG